MVGLVALPNGFILEAEYQETIGRFSYLYRRRFCTFLSGSLFIVRVPLSYLQVSCCLDADQVFVQPWYLGCIFRNRGLYFRPSVKMCHLYSIFNHLRVPRLWVE